jgi:ACR3 family arsenite transporter
MFMGIFERYLSLWVALAMATGVTLGNIFPAIFTLVAGLEFAHVNILVAILIWVMIYPMMVQVDFSSLKNIAQRPKGIVLTLIVNWLIKPFTMAALGWLFFKILFVDWVDPQTAQEYIAGMILLGVAPCTAMVFVWSQLTKGDANYTLVQVSINDLIMVVAFAPIAAFLLGISDIQVPWATLIVSVGLYVLIPLVAGVMTRTQLEKNHSPKKPQQLQSFLSSCKPWSTIGLLGTIVLLFGFQAQTIVSKPLAIFLIAIPLLIQSYFVFAIAFVAAHRMQLPYPIAAPACMIGSSNFFELAVAVSISLFGLQSGAALATVVGVLVEVPVMLSLVAFCNRTQHWFPQNKV